MIVYTDIMDGITRCSRYAFGPNRLHYCGPDANKEMKGLIENNPTHDGGLSHLLKQFKTLFPYLKHIAVANGIRDPFDSRVVEAYWLGNDLLATIEKRELHTFLVDEMRLKDKINNKEFRKIEEKIGRGALPHHSFHVLNIWSQEGHTDLLESVARMGECQISSGIVVGVHGPKITVSTEPLVYQGGKLALGLPIERVITRSLESEYDIERIKIGEIVSIHWGVPCEVITKEQAETLRSYTLKNIAFANTEVAPQC